MPNPSSTKYWLALLALASLGTAGCRTTSDNQIDLLERELRTQEDYIYELEDYVVEYSEKLRDCRCVYPQQTAVYTEQLDESQPAPPYSKQSTKKKTKKSTNRSSAKEKSVLETSEQKKTKLKNPEDDLPSPEQPQPETPQYSPEISPEELEVPDFEFELEEPVSNAEPVNPLRQVASTEPVYAPTGRRITIIPDPVDYQPSADAYETDDYKTDDYAADKYEIDDYDTNDYDTNDYDTNEYAADEYDTDDSGPDGQQHVEDLFEDDQLQPTLAPSDRMAERVEITQLFRDGQDGDSPQSLLTIVEALDANNEPVDLVGEVSLMVMTTDQESPQRLKRWNFDTEETTAAWQSSDLGDGLHLELPLDQLELPQEPVELWVRLVTSDGRKLLTQLPFRTEQLTGVDSYEVPQTPTTGLRLVETEEVPLPPKSLPLPPEKLQQVQEIEPIEVAQSENQPRWRASMQRTDRSPEGFATTSGTAKGWIAQPLGRQQQAPARVASHNTAPPQPQPTTKKSPVTWAPARR